MNFDAITDRHGTWALKWDKQDQSPGEEEVIPLWVADMDFPSPPVVTGALQRRVSHGIYGYTQVPADYYKALVSWYKSRYGFDQYGFELKESDFVSGRGAVPSLGTAVRTWSRPGDRVLILTPVYYPFFDVIRRNGRKTLEVPMALKGEGRYCFDISEIEAALDRAVEEGERVPLMLLCSPHNPGGSVWTGEELKALLELAARRGFIIVSDEIHGDFVFPPRRFLSLASFPEYASLSVVVSGTNKSFNLGGLHVSHFVLRDERLKAELKAGLAAESGNEPDIFSLVAAEAALSGGAPWLDELKVYLRENIEETVTRLNKEIPGIRAYRPQGTYLVWADVSAQAEKMNCAGDTELVRELELLGRVKLTPGSVFGRQGRGFVRINTACPRSQLGEALNRMAYFFSKSRTASSLT
jgi:cystathionine beta-lyase